MVVMQICYGGRPRQTCQIFKTFMESNGDGGIFVGWGMSIASKQAKERQNRTPDELVMVKTVKQKQLKSQGPDIRGSGRISGA